MRPLLVLINPWIYDFAAYDLWCKPLGLLYLASSMREAGFRVHLIDCLDVYHPSMSDLPFSAKPVRHHYGTGKFWRTKVQRPNVLRGIPRPYSRYGMGTHHFLRELQKIERPAAILVTSLMTYWYPGVQEVIRLCKETHPEAPVILGGLYARLCRGHALRFSGADYVASGHGPEAVKSLLHILEEHDMKPEREDLRPEVFSYPALDLLSRIEYVPLLTGKGCPFRCPYCASPFLNPRLERREPEEVLEEVLFWHRGYGVRDFVFYDDALLAGARSHANVLMEEIARRKLGLRFHTPNALHVGEINLEVASLLSLAGFRTIRLGLETSDMVMHREMGGKVTEGSFERAVGNLTRAGFTKSEIGAYILMGLPGQTVASVKTTIEFADKAGAMPYLAEYSPLPHTSLWEKAVQHSPYDLPSEPLWHNNTLLPCWDDGQRSEVQNLKALVQRIRRRET